MSKISVSLFVRLWVEIFSDDLSKQSFRCQPLREAVSWNGTGGILRKLFWSQPLREAVSWNARVASLPSRTLSQPLREAVSWNKKFAMSVPARVTSASSWGCELKYTPWYQTVDSSMSASSWGCELKSFKVSDKRHPQLVSLFVRLWVEIIKIADFVASRTCQPLREAVSWNGRMNIGLFEICGQPLREAVSWNYLVAHR